MPLTLRPFLLAAALSFAASSALAQTLENRLTIVTSFSKDVTEPFSQAFQKKYPGTRVEVQNRNTNAAVTFIRETRSSPPGRSRGMSKAAKATRPPNQAASASR